MNGADIAAKPPPTPLEMAAGIARSVVERAEAQGWTGKRRDDLTMECCIGALMMAIQLQCDESPAVQHLSRVLAMCIAPRGYSEVERLAAVPAR